MLTDTRKPAAPVVEHSVRHTRFDAAKLQAVIDRRWAFMPAEAGPAPRIENYEQFQALLPAMDGASYSALATQVFQQHADTPFYVGGSSGTTSKSKLVLAGTPVPDKQPSDEQRGLIHLLRREGVFGPGDVVANCFMVGLFSILHHGVNRILDACRASTVPVGSFDEDNVESQLRFLQQCQVNTVVGTPGTLVQLANAARRSGIALDIRKIAFTGERLGHAKSALLRQVFPGVRLIGLYGISECGFVAIGDELAEDYRIREDAYFLETDDEGQLLVTCLDPALPVPLLRYMPGDRISLRVGADDIARIGRVERSNLDFNFMGNLVEVRVIAAAVAQGLGLDDPLIDITLRTDTDGRDLLAIRVFGLDDRLVDFTAARQMIQRLPELREALEKRAGEVSVHGAPLEAMQLSGRQKQRQIIDLRH